MRVILFVILVLLLFTECSVKKNNEIGNWKVSRIKTNYIQKGQSDSFDLPVNLKGSQITWENNQFNLSEIKGKYNDLLFNDEFEDIIMFDKKVKFTKIKLDALSLKFPGDEISECVHTGIDSCLISENFLRLLESKNESIFGYISETGKHSKSKLILFVVKENKKLVLYDENDFLMLFLKPVK